MLKQAQMLRWICINARPVNSSLDSRGNSKVCFQPHELSSDVGEYRYCEKKLKDLIQVRMELV